MLLGTVWLISLWVAGGAVTTPTWEVPILGAMPVPTILVVGGLVAWFLLGRLLSWHAGRLGGVWADRLAAELGRNVGEVVQRTVDEPLAERDAARRAIWDATRP